LLTVVADDVSFEPVEALVHPVESCVDLCEARVDRVEAQMTRASNRSRAWMTHVAWRPTTPSRAATIVKTRSHSILTGAPCGGSFCASFVPTTNV